MHTFSDHPLPGSPHPRSATCAEQEGPELLGTHVSGPGSGTRGPQAPWGVEPQPLRATLGGRQPSRDRPEEEAASESGGPRPRAGARKSGHPPRRAAPPPPARPPAPDNKAAAEPRRPASAPRHPLAPEPASEPPPCFSLTLLHVSVPESTTSSGEVAAPTFHTDGEGTQPDPHGSSGEMAPTAAPGRRSQRPAPAQKGSSRADPPRTGRGCSHFRAPKLRVLARARPRGPRPAASCRAPRALVSGSGRPAAFLFVERAGGRLEAVPLPPPSGRRISRPATAPSGFPF